MEKRTSLTTTIFTFVCSVAMLGALLLPLVNIQSYRFGINDLPHKIERLVHGGFNQIVGYVLLVLLVLAPTILSVFTIFHRRPPLAVALLPAIVALLFNILLWIAPQASPAIGMYVYLILALICPCIVTIEKT